MNIETNYIIYNPVFFDLERAHVSPAVLEVELGVAKYHDILKWTQKQISWSSV